jgi:GLPGLI family protein
MGSFSFSQNVEVTYEAKFIAVPDSESIKKLSPSDLAMTMRMSQKLAKSVEKQQMVLIANDTSFVLTVEEQMDLEIESMSSAVGRSVLHLYSYVYAKDNTSSYGYDVGKEYIVQFSNSSVSWEITIESKDILGFKCFKAVPDYKYITEDQKKGLPTHVWFTPQINKKGGPTVYFDVPGLILEVESKNVRITAIEISETDTKVEFPTSNKEVISSELNDQKIHERTEARKRMMKR